MTGPDPLRVKLNTETGKLGWHELERHYAHGAVVVVARGTDLVEAAARFAEDDRQAVERWLTSGELRRANFKDAERWSKRDATLWAVVVAPWVLVQETAG